MGGKRKAIRAGLLAYEGEERPACRAPPSFAFSHSYCCDWFPFIVDILRPLVPFDGLPPSLQTILSFLPSKEEEAMAYKVASLSSPSSISFFLFPPFPPPAGVAGKMVLCAGRAFGGGVDELRDYFPSLPIVLHCCTTGGGGNEREEAPFFPIQVSLFPSP